VEKKAVIRVSGISGQWASTHIKDQSADDASRHSRFFGQRHVVSAAPVWRRNT
jgi:hypothetical protein